MEPEVGDRVRYDGRVWTIIEVRDRNGDRWVVLQTDDASSLATKAWLRQAQWPEMQRLDPG